MSLQMGSKKERQVESAYDSIASETGETTGRQGWWPILRPLVLRIHFYAGVLVAPFIVVASVTGLLYTLAPQVEQIAYHELTHVTPDGRAVSLSDQVAAARAAHPDGDIVQVDAPEGADRSTRVVFTDETVPTDYNMSVFVNPPTPARSWGRYAASGSGSGSGPGSMTCTATSI